MKKILMVLGSNRVKSFNGQLANLVTDYLKGKADVEFLKYDDVPFMNQDIEFPAPAAVERVRKTVIEADGLWIISPEYNFSYPAIVKNLVDWLSRPLKPMDNEIGSAIKGKKITMSGIGGKNATASMRGKLHELLDFVMADTMKEPEAGLTVNDEAWGSDVVTFTDEQKSAIEAQAEAFLKFIS